MNIILIYCSILIVGFFLHHYILSRILYCESLIYTSLKYFYMKTIKMKRKIREYVLNFNWR